MRKSLSVDNHLGSLSYAVHPAESKAERVRTKLRRQFVSIGPGCPRLHARGFPKTLTSWRAIFVPNVSKTTEREAAPEWWSRWWWQLGFAQPVTEPLSWGSCPLAPRGSGWLRLSWVKGDEGLDSGHCCPKHGTRLKGGNEFSCPRLRVCEELHLSKGLSGASSEGLGQQGVRTESLGQLRASWPLGAPGGRTAGMHQGCTAAVAASDQCLMGSASSLSQRHRTRGLGCPSPPR